MGGKVLFGILTLLLVLAGSASGHGLTAEESKILVVTGDERFRIKLLLEPANIEFVRPNIIEVSILDMVEAQHFYGKVQARLFHDDRTQQPVALASSSFAKGWFVTQADFKRAGQYQLVIELSNKDIERSYSLTFTMGDDRSMPLMVALGAGLAFAILIGVLGRMIKKQQRAVPAT